MTSDRHVWNALHPSADSDRICACGQSLDCCTRAHCPRCGEHLRAAA